MQHTVTVSRESTTPRSSLGKEGIRRLYHGIVSYSTIGGSPEMKHERDSRMRSLIKTSGRSSQEIQEVAEMVQSGASIGARNRVESWFSSRH